MPYDPEMDFGSDPLGPGRPAGNSNEIAKSLIQDDAMSIDGSSHYETPEEYGEGEGENADLDELALPPLDITHTSSIHTITLSDSARARPFFRVLQSAAGNATNRNLPTITDTHGMHSTNAGKDGSLSDDLDELVRSDMEDHKQPKGTHRPISTPDRASGDGPTSVTSVTAGGVTTTIRKRGRSTRWRSSMAYTSTTSGPPAPPKPPKIPSRKGKSRKEPSPPPEPLRQIYDKTTANYIPFLCEWKGCPAELQNCETLRRHVQIVHGRKIPQLGKAYPAPQHMHFWEDSKVCLWGKCAEKLEGVEENDSLDSSKGTAAAKFYTLEAFMGHIEHEHLRSLLWRVGDGPKNGFFIPKKVPMRGDANPLPDYLFDWKGNQVTMSLGEIARKNSSTAKRVKYKSIKREERRFAEARISNGIMLGLDDPRMDSAAASTIASPALSA